MLDPTPTGQRLGETPLLQTVGLTKRYGDFLANEQIDIDIWPRQIHALLGENGAGKSTLVKTIYGLIQPSDGEMRWQGEKMVLSGPSEARARGIGMVFQHFSLFDNLTVAENVALGLDGKESFKDMSARLQQVSNAYGLPLDPRREVWQLSVGERQRTDIKEVRAAAGRQTTVPRLVVNDLSLVPDDPHGVRLEHISLELKGGEILGIAGVAGNGQDELFAALSGERLAQDPGTIVIDGHAAGHLSITQRRRLGAAFVPEERLGHGTAPRMKLSDNALLTGHAASGMVKRGFVNRTAMLDAVDRTTEVFDVRKAKRDPEAVSLSGGNLQKFVVGREILREPGVLVVSQPTWGVDAGAAATIRQALIDLAARRAAVLVIS